MENDSYRLLAYYGLYLYDSKFYLVVEKYLAHIHYFHRCEIDFQIFEGFTLISEIR